MPINPNIALAVKPIEVGDPLAQYGKVAAIQNAQNQNALAQYQLSAAQREDAATNALNAAYKDAFDTATGEVDINKLRQTLASGGFGSKLPAIEKTLTEGKKAKVELQAKEGELLDAALKRSRGFLETLDPNAPGAAEAYLAWHEANHKDPIIGRALAARGITADQSRARIMQMMQQPGGLAQLINESKLGTEKFIELNKPQLITSNLGRTTETTAFSPLTGQTNKVLTQTNTIAPADAERIRQEGQRIGLEGRRVAVAEEQARLAKDPAFQQQMATARATGEALAKGGVVAQQALPQIEGRATETLNVIDQMIGKRDKDGNLIKGAKPHPGFENAVGATWLPGIRFVPGTDAAGFQALYDQVKGGAFLQAFESLKGGGAITEKEGEKGTAALTRMQLSTNEKEFVQAAREFRQIVENGVAEARRKAAAGAARVPGAPAAPAAPATAPTVSNW